jgi:hypothetical protein
MGGSIPLGSRECVSSSWQIDPQLAFSLHLIE